jgi:hypothetical protein
MYYTLHYYLADDTVEMLENLPRNSGRDPYPVFWRRAELRKNPWVSAAPGMLEPEPAHYKQEDFIVGETVQVYSRSIFLYDCDDFTRDFYKRYTGMMQQKIPVEDKKPEIVQLTYPPHNGFGSEEDSMASCLHLTPRAPRRDVSKLMGDQGKVLRFQGQMMNGKSEDTNRRFIVAIYLADDSVGVWELRQRNSGHAQGKFASKSKKKNPATGTWFCPTDFQIGISVEVNCTPFLLVRGDDATLRYMEKYPRDFPSSDIRRICRKLDGMQGRLVEKGELTTAEEVKQVAEEGGVYLNAHELITVRRACGVVRDEPEDSADPTEEAFDAKEAPAIVSTQRLLETIEIVCRG